MKKSILAAICLSAATAVSANVTINLGAGFLYGADASSPIPEGGLVQLVASSTDSIFAPVTAGSFTSGDDVVLASFAFSSAGTGMPGFTLTPLDISYNGAVGQGDAIMLRWFPTLTTASLAPTLGTIYGQFRTDSIAQSSDIAWFLPADSSLVGLNFATNALGGDSPEILGLASYTVTAVPEPATYAAILGLVTLGLVSYRRFRRR